MEYLDIVDEQGNPTGETVSRQTAHEKGILHRTSHVWIARRNHGKVELLIQKRCASKDSHPGCYDISSAGHIPAGEDFASSAIRELKEELGIEAGEEELIACGIRNFEYETSFHGKPFHDHQISKVYLLWRDELKLEEIVPQESEIDSVCFTEYDTLYHQVEHHQILNCIRLQELDMIQSKFCL